MNTEHCTPAEWNYRAPRSTWRNDEQDRRRRKENGSGCEMVMMDVSFQYRSDPLLKPYPSLPSLVLGAILKSLLWLVAKYYEIKRDAEKESGYTFNPSWTPAGRRRSYLLLMLEWWLGKRVRRNWSWWNRTFPESGKERRKRICNQIVMKIEAW